MCNGLREVTYFSLLSLKVNLSNQKNFKSTTIITHVTRNTAISDTPFRTESKVLAAVSDIRHYSADMSRAGTN
jgi:hypothetical protein